MQRSVIVRAASGQLMDALAYSDEYGERVDQGPVGTGVWQGAWRGLGHKANELLECQKYVGTLWRCTVGESRPKFGQAVDA